MKIPLISSNAARPFTKTWTLQRFGRGKHRIQARKVIGYLPVYVPREIIHAAGMLPVGMLGGGDQARSYSR